MGRSFISVCAVGTFMLGAMPGGVQAQQDCTPAAFPGSPVVKINQTSDAQSVYNVDLEYNSRNDAFLFVWAGYNGDDNDVWGQIASLRSGFYGSTLHIADSTASQTEASVVYNSVDNQYLVTWRYQNGAPGSQGFNHAFGRVLNADGSGFSNETDLCDAGFEATLAHNAAANEYVVHARNFAGTGGGSGIKARRIGADGSPLGSTRIIETAGAPAPAGVLLHNSNDGTYLSTWRNQTFLDLRGRMLDTDLTPLTASYLISSVPPESGLAAGGAFDASRDQFLVVFSTFSGGPMYAQLLDGAGNLVGSAIELEGTSTRKSVTAAYNPTSDTHLVVWTESDTSNVRAQLISADDGTRLGGQITIASSGAFSAAQVEADPLTGDFIVAWTGTHPHTGETQCVLAALVDVRAGADFAKAYGVINGRDARLYLKAFNFGLLVADLAEPFGVLDQADQDAFEALYLNCR